VWTPYFYAIISCFQIDGPQTVIFNPPNPLVTVEEGATITPIICTADCNPPCTLRWIHTSSTGDTSFNGGNLNLGSADRSDNGTYRCEAQARNPVPSELRRGLSEVIRIDVQCKFYIIHETQCNLFS